MATSRIRIGNAESQLNALRKRDLERRQRATTILEPEHLAGTKIAAAHVLQMTQGGERRPLTQRDLARFRTKIAEIGTKLRGGITAQEAIDLSRPIDIERCRTEIRYATPTLVRAGEVRFLTDSGPHSKVTRHHTRIEFIDWSAAIARPATPAQAATWLCREGRVRLECQCEAFTLWGFRYLATIGNYVLGRKEDGLPKIRLPSLSGCLCKHLVRTLTVVQVDPLVRRRIAEAIDLERKRLERPSSTKVVTVRISQAEADRVTSGPVRRITFIRPEQRTGLPNTASASDIEKALQRFQRRTDKNGQAIARALESLLRHQQGSRT